MQTKALRIVGAYCMLLLAGQTQAGEAKWALGLQLIDSRDLGLWKIGPDRAWGLTLKGHNELIQSEEKRFVSAGKSLVVIDFLSPRESGTPLWFVELGGDLQLWLPRGDEYPKWSDHFYTGSFTVGMGVFRELTDQFRVSVFQGIETSIIRDGGPDEDTSHWGFSFSRPRVVAYWMF